MALVNTILIDLSGQVGSLTSTSSSSPVETISYAVSTNQITFLERQSIVIAGADFLTLIIQMNIFQTALIANFSVNNFITTPYTVVTSTESNHSPTTPTCTLTSVIGAAPMEQVVSYSADSTTGNVTFNYRVFNQTINLPEWVNLLTILNHYRASVKSFLSL